MAKWRTVVAASVLALAASAATATTASAADRNWTWAVAGGNHIGVASYTDSGDVIRVNDQEKDGRSLVLDVWRTGHSGGVHYRCWDSTGSGTKGVHCDDSFRGSGWGVNAKLTGRLCRGESGGPGGGKITSCQPQSKWKTFYR